MTLKQSRFIAVSIGQSCVKAAQVTRAGVVEKLSQKSVSGGNVDEALRASLSGFAVKEAGVVCVMPAEVATTKLLEVPSADREEIESIIALQATRHTPFNKDEIITGYIKTGTPRPGFTKLLLIVVKREAVKEKLAFMRKAGLDVAQVLFAPEAAARFYARPLASKKGETVALLDVAMQGASFIVASEGIPLMARNIPVGIDAVNCDPSALDQLVQEARASFETFEQEGGLRPSRIVLTREHPALAAIDGKLAEVLGFPVEIMPYMDLVKGGSGLKDQLAREFADESALDVLVTGVMALKCAADLVPQEIKDQRSVAEKGRETMKAGIFVLLALFFIGGGLLSQVYFKDAFLKQNLVDKYSDQKKQVALLESMVSKTRVLRDYLQARQLPLEAMRELYNIIPEEMYLSSISMDDAGNVAIQGISESMSRVFTVVTALEESPLFEGVKTKSTTAKKDRGKDVAAFEITLKLSMGVPGKQGARP